MSGKHNSMRRRLKRLFSFNDSSYQDNVMSPSPTTSNGGLPTYCRMTQSYSGALHSPMESSRDIMTQSLTDTDLQRNSTPMSECNKDCCFTENGDDNSEEVLAYTRGATRRPCIISDWELGFSMDELEHEKYEDVSSDAMQSKYLRRGTVTPPNSHAVEVGKSVVLDQRGSKERPLLARYNSENNIIRNSSLGISTDRSKSLSRSLIKRLPSRKKTTANNSLQDFLSNELPATHFHDYQLIYYKERDWRQLVDSKDIAGTFNKADGKRLTAIWELFHNECVFLIDRLLTLKHVFLEPLKRCQVEGYLMSVEPFKLFGNIDDLCCVSYGFCQDFMKTVTETEQRKAFGSTDALVDCLENMTLNSQHGDIYHSYVLNYKEAVQYLSTLRDEVEEFGIFENFCEADSRCNRLKLTDLLVAPMHHWTRLPLVLTRIRDYTNDQEERDSLDYCIENVKSSLQSLDDKMEWQRTFDRVREIDKQLIWPSAVDVNPAKLYLPESLKKLVKVTDRRGRNILADATREVLYEGQLLLTEPEKTTPMRAFLFNDLFLLTRVKKEFPKSRINRLTSLEKKAESFKVVHDPIPVETLSVHDLSEWEEAELNVKHAFVLVQTNKFEQIVTVMTLQSSTSLGKEGWLKNIQQALEKISTAQEETTPKQTEQPETFRLADSPHLKTCRVLKMQSSLKSLPRNHGNFSASVSGLSTDSVSSGHSTPPSIAEEPPTLAEHVVDVHKPLNNMKQNSPADTSDLDPEESTDSVFFSDEESTNNMVKLQR